MAVLIAITNAILKALFSSSTHQTKALSRLSKVLVAKTKRTDFDLLPILASFSPYNKEPRAPTSSSDLFLEPQSVASDFPTHSHIVRPSQHTDTTMSPFSLPRPAPSLPVNEASTKHSPRHPTKTFSSIITHLKREHDSSTKTPEVPNPLSTRPISSQSCNVDMFLASTPRFKTLRTAIKEISKTTSTIMSHCSLPSSPKPPVFIGVVLDFKDED